MPKTKSQTEAGVILEVMPKGLYSVRTANGERVTCHLARDVRMMSVHVLIGQGVHVQRAQNDGSRGRIVELDR